MEKKLIRDEALSLEGDGFIPKIYSLLTYKNPIFGKLPTVYVPDTIVFKFNTPEIWYFGNDRGVRKKLKSNVTFENIEKSFLRKTPKHGIVAQYIVSENNSDQKKPSFTFSYITKEDFKTFLYSNKPNGILQKFVTPNGPNNFVIKVNWSPNFCLYEKIENTKHLDDTNNELYQKAMTLEGKDYQVRTMPLRGSVLPHKLSKLSHSIYQHIRMATGENTIVARMSLIFKIDEHDNIWFLYCTSLRIQPYEDQLQANRESIGMSIKPEDLAVNFSSPKNFNPYRSFALKTKTSKKEHKCQNCFKEMDGTEIVKVPLNQIITAFEDDRKGNTPSSLIAARKPVKKYGVINLLLQPKPEEINMTDPTIPRIILSLYPELTQKEYERLKREPGFLYQETMICEDCYLKMSRSSEFVQHPHGIAREYESFHPFGTGELRPDVLKQRRTTTRSKLNNINQQLYPLLRIMKDRVYEDPEDEYDLPRRATTVKHGKTRAKTQDKSTSKIVIPMHMPELNKTPMKSFLTSHHPSENTKEQSQTHITEESEEDIIRAYAGTMLLPSDSDPYKTPLRQVKSSNSFRKPNTSSLQNLLNPSEGPFLKSFYVGGQGNSSSVKNNKHNESAGPFSSTKANTTTKQNQTSYQLPKMVMTPPKTKQIIISKGDEPCIAVSSNLLKKIERIKVINKMDKTSMLGEYETMLGSMTKQIKQRQQSKNLSVEY